MNIIKQLIDVFSFSKKEEIDLPDEPIEIKVKEEDVTTQSEEPEEVSVLPEANEHEDVSSEEDAVSHSLLDNNSYMLLAEQCSMVHDELDRMSLQVADPMIQDFIVMQKSRIREALILSGARIIDEETEFNRLRHQPAPPSMVSNGTPISETIEAGIEIDNRIMIKAKIRI